MNQADAQTEIERLTKENAQLRSDLAEVQAYNRGLLEKLKKIEKDLIHIRGYLQRSVSRDHR